MWRWILNDFKWLNPKREKPVTFKTVKDLKLSKSLTPSPIKCALASSQLSLHSLLTQECHNF